MGWCGLILTLAGLGDFLLTWVPPEFGSPEWEFGTIAASFSGLPLVTMGFAALLGSALARGVRGQVLAIGLVLAGLGIALLGALGLFGLTIPVALSAVEGVARMGIMKAIARTVLLGVLFTTGYLFAGIAALRRFRTMGPGQKE